MPDKNVLNKKTVPGLHSLTPSGGSNDRSGEDILNDCLDVSNLRIGQSFYIEFSFVIEFQQIVGTYVEKIGNADQRVDGWWYIVILPI